MKIMLFFFRRMPGCLVIAGFAVAILMPGITAKANAQDEPAPLHHLVEPGDTWQALAWRYGVSPADLRAANPHPNLRRQPSIGKSIAIPPPVRAERTGTLQNSLDGGLLQISSGHGLNPWHLALLNGLPSPNHPLLLRPIFIPGGLEPPRQFPIGFRSLQLTKVPTLPGQGFAFRAIVDLNREAQAAYAGIKALTFTNGPNLVGLLASGAFFPPGDYEFSITQQDAPLWSQPWPMAQREWTFEEITYSGAAAAIDQAAIKAERERLMAIWQQATPQPQWTEPFRLPIEQFLVISSYYGARRSYNGGPYQSYHEGVDFAAYGGTPVFASAAGTVMVAESLVARGGSVIIDHGLGIYSGVYHLSEVLAQAGQRVVPGQLIGRVGSTGLSTGNHLHWDLLIGGTWIDGQAWLEDNIACWILEGWGLQCGNQDPSSPEYQGTRYDAPN